MSDVFSLPPKMLAFWVGQAQKGKATEVMGADSGTPIYIFREPREEITIIGPLNVAVGHFRRVKSDAPKKDK